MRWYYIYQIVSWFSGVSSHVHSGTLKDSSVVWDVCCRLCVWACGWWFSHFIFAPPSIRHDSFSFLVLVCFSLAARRDNCNRSDRWLWPNRARAQVKDTLIQMTRALMHLRLRNRSRRIENKWKTKMKWNETRLAFKKKCVCMYACMVALLLLFRRWWWR